MENTAYVALSRQMALSEQMDVIANNLANLNTTAFKGESTLFVEHLEETGDGETLSLVQDLAVVRNLNQGPLTVSDNPLDMAIDGDGYFMVETDAGVHYTRAGSFSLDQDGQIVTLGGEPILSDAGGPIIVPIDAGTITIARDGTVSSKQGEIGRIRLVRFDNEQLLVKTESGLYEAGEAEPLPVEDPQMRQGMLEGSNVIGVVEMSNMILTVRNYQAANRLLQEEDERIRQAIETLITA